MSLDQIGAGQAVYAQDEVRYPLLDRRASATLELAFWSCRRVEYGGPSGMSGNGNFS